MTFDEETALSYGRNLVIAIEVLNVHGRFLAAEADSIEEAAESLALIGLCDQIQKDGDLHGVITVFSSLIRSVADHEQVQAWLNHQSGIVNQTLGLDEQ